MTNPWPTFHIFQRWNTSCHQCARRQQTCATRNSKSNALSWCDCKECGWLEQKLKKTCHGNCRCKRCNELQCTRSAKQASRTVHVNPAGNSLLQDHWWASQGDTCKSHITQSWIQGLVMAWVSPFWCLTPCQLCFVACFSQRAWDWIRKVLIFTQRWQDHFALKFPISSIKRRIHNSDASKHNIIKWFVVYDTQHLVLDDFGSWRGCKSALN